MLTEQIQDLWEESFACARNSDAVVWELRRWNTDISGRTLQDLLYYLNRFIEKSGSLAEQLNEVGIHIDLQELMGIFQNVLDAQAKNDKTLLADYLTLLMTPYFLKCNREFAQYVTQRIPDYLEENLEALSLRQPEVVELLRRYMETDQFETDKQLLTVEPTEIGYQTARFTDGDQDFYLYSNVNPYTDMLTYIDSVLAWNKAEYHLQDPAMAYIVYAINRITRESVPVITHHSRMATLYSLLRYNSLSSQIRRELLFIVIDPMLKQLAIDIRDNDNQVILYPPCLGLVPEKGVIQSYEKYNVANQSMREQRFLIYANYKMNKRFGLPNVDLFEDRIRGKKVYIIAAGPSLDKNMELLKKREENSLIMATGTVLRKLMNAGIRPDCIIATEGNERASYQIGGFEQQDIPLLLLCSASPWYARHYQGPKYSVLQMEFDVAEQEAAQQGYRLYMTGGSVSTLALDVAIRLGAASVVFLGLDLAFTNMLAHATETSMRTAPSKDSLIEIDASDGGKVYADMKFILYRDWFMRRLKEEDARAIRIIDATEGGALIPGMEIMSMEDALSV